MKADARRLVWLGAFVVVCSLAGQSRMGPKPAARPAQRTSAMLEGVGVDEHLGRQIDLNLTFVAEDGYPWRSASISSRAVR